MASPLSKKVPLSHLRVSNSLKEPEVRPFTTLWYTMRPQTYFLENPMNLSFLHSSDYHYCWHTKKEPFKRLSFRGGKTFLNDMIFQTAQLAKIRPPTHCSNEQKSFWKVWNLSPFYVFDIRDHQPIWLLCTIHSRLKVYFGKRLREESSPASNADFWLKLESMSEIL